MAKRKKKSKSSSKLIYVVWFLSIVLLFLVVFIVGYYIGQDDTKPKHQTPVLKEAIKKEPAPAKEQKPKKEEILEDRLKDILKSEQNSTTLEQNISKADENITLKQKQEPLIDASHEIDSKALAEPIKREKIKLKTKARLAIVIDDVSTKTQVDNIKSLNIPLTMSFLPPSKERPNSNVLAQKEPFYMVHLPMEALHFNAEEPHTLRVNDSKEQILHRIEDIK